MMTHEEYEKSVRQENVRGFVTPADALEELDDLEGSLLADLDGSVPADLSHGKNPADQGTSLPEKTDYPFLVSQAEALAEDSRWDITLLANISALLYETLENINWAGFYLMRDKELALGPFQGKPACTRIQVGKGVCGTAVQQERVIRVEDVHAFAGHIACDSASVSEIVLPIRRDMVVVGVLDIDSPVRGRFTAEDETGLQQIVRVIENSGCLSRT